MYKYLALPTQRIGTNYSPKTLPEGIGTEEPRGFRTDVDDVQIASLLVSNDRFVEVPRCVRLHIDPK